MIKSKILNSLKLKNKTSFNKWKRVAERNNLKINNIKVIGEVNRHNSDFCISTIDGTFTKDKKKIKRVIQLEGDSVVVIPILKIKNHKNVKTIVVQQFRAPVCKKTIEFPSGNVKSNDFKKQAVKEIKEEIGLEIKSSQLIRLNKKPIFMLPANNFARVIYYYFILKTDKVFLDKINNSRFGCENEGEYIQVKVKNLNELEDSTSASVLIGLKLLKKLNFK